MQNRVFSFLLFFSILAFSGTGLAADDSREAAIASRLEGGNVVYYASLHDALAAAFAAGEGASFSINYPDEITLLSDIILNDPIIIEENAHIRLIAGGETVGQGSPESRPSRTIMRGSELLDFPVIWVRGENASLTLGWPGMEGMLVVDGGWLNATPIIANGPVAAVSGPDSKLIMYDNVFIQNNINSGSPAGTNFYENGSGVFIRTEGDQMDRLAEFIMRGGVIQGNVNNVQSFLFSGGGVLLAGFGLFTMEGGVIQNNSVLRGSGGGVHLGSRASFRKTGGIIFGRNEPEGIRNTAGGSGSTPNIFGHAVNISLPGNPDAQYRNDTVGENDNLSYTGHATQMGVFGEGEKWDNPDKDFRRVLLIIIAAVLVLSVPVIIIVRKKIMKKRIKNASQINISIEGMSLQEIIEKADLTDHEKKVFNLLLTDHSLKMIADDLELSYEGVRFHCKKLYHKLNVKNRKELLVKYGSS